MIQMLTVFLWLSCLLHFSYSFSAFKKLNSITKHSNLIISMGLGDLLNKAFANDPNLPPAKNPGLSKAPEAISVEFLPAKKIIKAFPGEPLRTIAQSAGVEIKYGCKKGNCGTCSISFNGSIVKACQTSIPTSVRGSKVTIIVPNPK